MNGCFLRKLLIQWHKRENTLVQSPEGLRWTIWSLYLGNYRPFVNCPKFPNGQHVPVYGEKACRGLISPLGSMRYNLHWPPIWFDRQSRRTHSNAYKSHLRQSPSGLYTRCLSCRLLLWRELLLETADQQTLKACHSAIFCQTKSSPKYWCWGLGVKLFLKLDLP